LSVYAYCWVDSEFRIKQLLEIYTNIYLFLHYSEVLFWVNSFHDFSVLNSYICELKGWATSRWFLCTYSEYAVRLWVHPWEQNFGNKPLTFSWQFIEVVSVSHNSLLFPYVWRHIKRLFRSSVWCQIPILRVGDTSLIFVFSLVNA
jgi:hypothetical protein